MTSKTKAPTLGQRVAAYREKKGMSYREAQEASGVDKSNIHRAESGAEPSIRVFAKLAKWIGLRGKSLDETLDHFVD